ncbi:hypothetical protein [Roseimarinus sediminis]|uniref:hypothetical protein n=1 Tax=Roseimarinus sediminis TaxID=1610899 RepID=UPI003D205809
MRKRIKLLLFFGLLILMLFAIYRGYFSAHNTYVYVCNENDASYDSIDFVVLVDDLEILQDTLSDNSDWHLGKIYPIKLSPGHHNICINSQSLEYSNCKRVFTFLQSKIYIRFKGRDKNILATNDSCELFTIEKQIGSRFIIE